MPELARAALVLSAAPPCVGMQLRALRGAYAPSARRVRGASFLSVCVPAGDLRGRRGAALALAAARPSAGRGSGGEAAVPPGLGAVAAPRTRDGDGDGDGDGDPSLSVTAPAAGAAPAPARAKRAPNAGVRGEKTASGRPKPDERTVARLVELGWCHTPEAAEALLTKHTISDRFPYETAGLAIDWLIKTLGEEAHSTGRCCAATAVHRLPNLLSCSTSALQRGWEMVVQPRAAGGLGMSEAAARRRVASCPAVLHSIQESMLRRAALLEELGAADGRAAIATHFELLGTSEARLRSGAEFLRSQGLDVTRMMSSHPMLIRGQSQEVLSQKLDFLRSVAGLNGADIDSAFFTYSLEGRMRPRYFYALQRADTMRFSFGSLVKCSDTAFVKRVHGLHEPASKDEVDAYLAHTASPAFRAYMDEQERAIRASHA